MVDSDYTAFSIGAITAILGVVIGAILVAIWDYYKIHKDTIERERNLINAFKEEIISNKLTFDLNRDYVKNRKENVEWIIFPLRPILTELSSLIGTNFSYNLLNCDALKK